MSDVKNSMKMNDFLQHNEHDTPNTILIRELYDALNGGASTGEALFRILSDSPTWHVCPGTPESGTYHGLYDIFLSEDSFYRRLATVLIDLQGKPEVFIDGGDVVVALGHYCFRDTNRWTDKEGQVFTHMEDYSGKTR